MVILFVDGFGIELERLSIRSGDIHWVFEHKSVHSFLARRGSVRSDVPEDVFLVVKLGVFFIKVIEVHLVFFSFAPSVLLHPFVQIDVLQEFVGSFVLAVVGVVLEHEGGNTVRSFYSVHENEHFSHEFFGAVFFGLIVVGFHLLGIVFSSGHLQSFDSFNIGDSVFNSGDLESDSIGKELHRFIIIKIDIELHASEVSSELNFPVKPEGIDGGLSPGEFHPHVSGDQLVSIGDFGDINRGLGFSELAEPGPAFLIREGEVNPLVDFMQEEHMFHVFVHRVQGVDNQLRSEGLQFLNGLIADGPDVVSSVDSEAPDDRLSLGGEPFCLLLEPFTGVDAGASVLIVDI